MKVVLPKSEGSAKKKPLLPLVPDPEEELNASNSVSYLLRVKPADNNSPTFKKYVRVLTGNESVRTVLSWSEGQAKVVRGLNLTDAADQYVLTCGLLNGSAKTLYTNHIEPLCRAARETAANAAADNVAAQAERDRPLTDFVNAAMLRDGKREVLKGIIPNKAIAMVKRYLRRECRKPPEMKVRTFYQHLLRINEDELLALPPFNPGQTMSEDELVDILLYATPRSWSREMDRQGFDPVSNSLAANVAFMERIEQSEDAIPDHDSKPKASSNKKTKSSNTGGRGKYCLIHGQCSHSSDECKTLQGLAKESKSSFSGTKKKFGNKTWKKKSDDATTKEKKDLAASIKKSIKDGVDKELHSTDKKRKPSYDLNAFDEELKDFNYEDMENLSLDDDESSVEV